MALKLSNGEKELYSVHLHWSSYIIVGAWAFFGLLGFIGMIFAPENTQTPEQSKAGPMIMLAVIFFMPLAVRWLKNKCKTYAITDKRLCIEEGILSKNKLDIPYNKINDIVLKQGLIQRMFGSGNIQVFSGNSVPVIIKDIDNPNEFKDQIFNATQKVHNEKVA